MYTFKTIFNKEIRRFHLSKLIFSELFDIVQKAYSIDTPSLKYKDEDDDLISISSDAELQEGFRVSPDVLKLFVSTDTNVNEFEFVDLKKEEQFQDDIEDDEQQSQVTSSGFDSDFNFAKKLQEMEDMEFAKMLNNDCNSVREKKKKFTQFKKREPFKVVRVEEKVAPLKKVENPCNWRQPKQKFTDFKKREPFKITRIKEKATPNQSNVTEERCDWRQPKQKFTNFKKREPFKIVRVEEKVVSTPNSPTAKRYNQDQPKRKFNNFKKREPFKIVRVEEKVSTQNEVDGKETQCNWWQKFIGSGKQEPFKVLRVEKNTAVPNVKLEKRSKWRQERAKLRAALKAARANRAKATNIFPLQPLEMTKKTIETSVHSGITCANCHVFPIVGTRYSCSVCDDIDLCETCESEGANPDLHPMIKYKVPNKATERVHHGTMCGGCMTSPIIGVRFKCMVCDDFDLCSKCELKCEYMCENLHPKDHPMIKLRNPRHKHKLPTKQSHFQTIHQPNADKQPVKCPWKQPKKN